RLRDEWLKAKESRSGSRHTRRAYEKATNDWLDFLSEQRPPVQPWQVDTSHVRAWKEHLAERGLSANTINARLAACSSWYTFVINERHLVGGVERTAFFDAAGRTRANPFKTGNVPRERVHSYKRARPLSVRNVNALLTYLQGRQHLLTGSRNYALILTFLLTGWRNQEVVSMRWGDIRESRTQPGAYVFRWKGKGGKEGNAALPVRAYHAIVHHLRVAGRWLPGHPDHIADDDYIWQPLITHGLTNLNNQKEVPQNTHISTGTALQILRRSLRAAGVDDWQEYRIHDLRHTFAHRLHATTGDLEKLRQLLHHESLGTTGIYVREVLEDPIDDWSEGLYQSMLHI
ncbi:MAG TPA: hypothetical protein ENK56_06565, partial [Chloroflexi bacterium]|nr:hypothetical protein [Chloroflexota bacterium]